MRNGNATRCRTVEEMTELLKLCHNEPELFNKLFLKRPAYWSRQRDLCRSVVDYRTTVAYSGNMVGKDFWIAGIILWWLLTRPDALCIITGPSQMVLGSVTFKEIRRCVEGAALPFGGKLSSGIKASPAVIEIAPGWQALGFSTTCVERASGQHARHLLAVVEEASGVEDFVFDAIDSLGYERLVCIGNPIRAEGKFVDLIRQAARDRADDVPPRLAVNAIRIPSTESPHAQDEKSAFGLADRTWLDAMYRKYGRGSLWVGSHIDARIPDVDAEQLIDPTWLAHHSKQQRQSVPADSSRPPHQADRLRPVRGSGPRQHLRRGRRRLGRARGRAGQRHGLAGSRRDDQSAVEEVERAAREDHVRQAGDRPQLPEPPGAVGHHAGDPLRRRGQAARPELLRQPAHRGRLEAAQSAGYNPRGLQAGLPRLPTSSAATAPVPLLPRPLLCPAGRRATAIDVRPGRQEVQADAQGRVGDHSRPFARCRGCAHPEHDLDVMRGRPETRSGTKCWASPEHQELDWHRELGCQCLRCTIATLDDHCAAWFVAPRSIFY